MRKAEYARKTKETEIKAQINLDDCALVRVSTGIGFFDHMLTAMATHGGFSLILDCQGDLEVDGHHTVEDCGIVIGELLNQVLGNKSGIQRFGSFLLPMDDALARVAMDISGRPYLHFSAEFHNERIGSYETCLTKEFFQAMTNHAGITLHISLFYGENDHHGCEAIFKAVGHALRLAVLPNQGGDSLSTKGVLA